MLDMELSLIITLFLFGFLAAFIDSVVGGGGLISLPALMKCWFVWMPTRSMNFDDILKKLCEKR